MEVHLFGDENVMIREVGPRGAVAVRCGRAPPRLFDNRLLI